MSDIATDSKFEAPEVIDSFFVYAQSANHRVGILALIDCLVSLVTDVTDKGLLGRLILAYGKNYT